MELPKSITYQDLTFHQSLKYQNEYQLGTPTNKTKAYSRVKIYPNEQELIIHGINNHNVTKDLTQKTIDAFKQISQINKIKITSIQQKETLDLLLKFELGEFELSQLPNFEKSPFLKILSRNSYSNIEVFKSDEMIFEIIARK